MYRQFACLRLIPFLLLILLLFVAASPARADRVDDYVAGQLRERHIPGATVAVVKNGRLIKQRGYGLANVELKVPAAVDTVFEIGSISKQITAAGVMLLVEEGRVNLDEKIGKYLPGAPDVWNDVTVRHLLTHTSGIKSYTAIGAGFELTRRLKRDEFIAKLAAYPLDFPPGSRWNYSNSGYNLLGFIIESVTGASYWDFVRERIFKPLGMTATTDRDPQFIVPNRASGYEWQKDRLTGRDYDLTDVFSAGAIVSTVLDLAKWDAALRNNDFLKAESKAQIWTPVVLSDGKPYPYGFGWNIGAFRGHRLLSHGGQTAGFAANIARYVDDNLTIIVLTNLGDQGLGGDVSRGIAKIYLPDISLSALKANPSAAAPRLTNLFEAALRGRAQNKLPLNSFTADMRDSLTSERAELLTRRLASYGAINKFIFIGDEASPGKARVYRYKVETSSRVFLWRFSADETGKVSEMTLEEEEPRKF